MKTIQLSTLVLIGLALSCGALAQTQPHVHDHSARTPPAQNHKAHAQHEMTGGGMMGGDMMARCHEMMQKRDAMKADMKAMDDKLAGLTATMNSAPDSDKTSAVIAVVNELVAQRKKTADMTSGMEAGMMQHTMEHMQQGKQSMMMCPMMQGMHGAKSAAKKSHKFAKHPHH